ncbi:hypothetical protein [Brachybacterium sp. NBEC-018]|uniref:hypothetical protein n=1 Tax=Brachybacterium sp. NBEC-018 TaxID=2996004 RepID=UPI003A4C7E48
MAKALELYYVDNGKYPSSVGGQTTINTSWATIADASWATLESQLVPRYISELPKDPISTPGANAISAGVEGYNYA